MCTSANGPMASVSRLSRSKTDTMKRSPNGWAGVAMYVLPGPDDVLWAALLRARKLIARGKNLFRGSKALSSAEVKALLETHKYAKSVTIRNLHLAGKKHHITGIPFDKDGFPVFDCVSRKKVQIELTGARASDFDAANAAAGFTRTPEGYTWHHHQDGTTMLLVPADIHLKTGHTGGFGLYPK